MEVDAVEEPATQVSGTRRAWLAAGLAIPLYAILALVFGTTASAMLGALLQDPTDEELVAVSGVVLTLEHVLILVVGIATMSLTVGRWVDARTRSWTTPSAALAFAGTGALLSLLPGLIFVADGVHVLENVAFILVGLTVPCALTAGVTRLLMPRAEQRRGTRMIAMLAIAAALLTLAFGAYVALGPPW